MHDQSNTYPRRCSAQSCQTQSHSLVGPLLLCSTSNCKKGFVLLLNILWIQFTRVLCSKVHTEVETANLCTIGNLTMPYLCRQCQPTLAHTSALNWRAYKVTGLFPIHPFLHKAGEMAHQAPSKAFYSQLHPSGEHTYLNVPPLCSCRT